MTHAIRGDRLGSLDHFLQRDKPLNALCFSSDSNFLVAAAGESIGISDLRNKTLRKTLEGHTTNICALKMNSDDTVVVSASKDTGNVGDNITYSGKLMVQSMVSDSFQVLGGSSSALSLSGMRPNLMAASHSETVAL